METYLRPSTIADKMGVAQHTVCRWITSGKLRAMNIGKGVGKQARWLVTESAITDFEEDRANKPRPEPVRATAPAPSQWSRELDESEIKVKAAHPGAEVVERAGGFVIVDDGKQLSQAASGSPDRAWRSAARKIDRRRQG